MNTKEEQILLKTTTIIKPCTFNQKILGRATSFFCKNDKDELFLITNNHVTNIANHVIIYLTIQNATTKEIDFKNYMFKISDKLICHKTYDLCAVRFQPIYDELVQKNEVPLISYVPYSGIETNFSKYKRIEEVMIVGYPNSMINSDINFPIVRKGITATGLCDQYNGRDIFYTDITSNHGASGSPVYYINKENKTKLVGIHFAGRYEKQEIYKNQYRIYHKKKIGYIETPIGIGCAIKSNALLELINYSNLS